MIEENMNRNNDVGGDMPINEPRPEAKEITEETETTLPAPETAEEELTPQSIPSCDDSQPKYVYHWELGATDESVGTKKTKKKKNGGTATFVAVMIAALTVAILLLAAVIALTPNGASGAPSSLSALYESCCPYTVAVETDIGAIGSGFFVTENGYVVTNYHVIAGSASVLVYTNDSQKYSADIVGYDSELDLAVLKVNGKHGQTFPAAPIADSDKVKTGDSIIVIGTPERLDLAWSLTTGYVSYAKRESNMAGTMQTYIQINAGVNPGNSGGPLINSNGEVIGIVQARVKDKVEVYDANGQIVGYTMPGADGIGLAIPINKVIKTFNDIIDKNMEEPVLGITCVTVLEGKEYFMTDNTAYHVQINENHEKYYVSYDSFTQQGTTVILTDEIIKTGKLFTVEKSGIWIVDIADNSGAKGILEQGDIITAFGGMDLSSMASENTNLVDVIKDELAKYKAGDTVKVDYIRDGAPYSASITLTAKQ